MKARGRTGHNKEYNETPCGLWALYIWDIPLNKNSNDALYIDQAKFCRKYTVGRWNTSALFSRAGKLETKMILLLLLLLLLLMIIIKTEHNTFHNRYVHSKNTVDKIIRAATHKIYQCLFKPLHLFSSVALLSASASRRITSETSACLQSSFVIFLSLFGSR